MAGDIKGIQEQIEMLTALTDKISSAIKNLKRAADGYVVTQDSETVLLHPDQIAAYQAEADKLIAELKADASKDFAAALEPMVPKE